MTDRMEWERSFTDSFIRVNHEELSRWNAGGDVRNCIRAFLEKHREEFRGMDVGSVQEAVLGEVYRHTHNGEDLPSYPLWLIAAHFSPFLLFLILLF